MITIRRLLIREFLIIGSIAVLALMGLRGSFELWVLREQATSQAEISGRLVADAILHQTRGAEGLGEALALMWRRGELAPGQPGTELALEGLLRQSQVENLVLADTAGRLSNAHRDGQGFVTRSLTAGGRVLETRWDADGRPSERRIMDLPSLDYTQRPWYRQAMTRSSPSWTPAYAFIEPAVEGITYCTKVVDGQGRVLGVVGVDLRLDRLNALMQHDRPSPGALVSLAGPDGRGIAPSIAPSQDARDAELGHMALASGAAASGWPMVRSGGRAWLLHKQRIEGPGWTLVTAIPFGDLAIRPGRITIISLLIGALTLTIIAIRLAVAARRVTLPLTELARSSEGLLAGEPVPLPPTDIEELAQAREALQAASTGMLERHRLELELQRVQRLELAGAMASGLAHDLNNHLSTIQAQLDLLALEAPSPASGARLTRAQEAAERMARLLQDLVAFGKPRAIVADPVDLNALVAEAGRLLEHSRGKRMQMELDLDPALPAVAGDRIQLEQVILNLGFNAKDATPEGGRLSLRTGLKDGEAFFEVRDTGTGMTPEVKEKLFTPFFSTKGSDKGTGLGLAMVASIVKAHHGRILVESEPGFGSAFTVWLPLAKG